MSKPDSILIIGPAGALEVVVHIPHTAPRGIAIIAHPLPTQGGTMEHKIVTTLAKTFIELDFVALRFNFRGVGASAGTYNDGQGEVEDAIAVADYARAKFGNLPLALSGFSFGGYVQACAAQQLKPQYLVLIAPAVVRFNMPPVPDHTLVIHGEVDEVIPLSAALQWARPQHLPIVVMPDTGHYFHGQLHKIKELVRHYFMGHIL
jgi:uncharacterized protein